MEIRSPSPTATYWDRSSMNTFQHLSLQDMPATRSRRARGRGRGRGQNRENPAAQSTPTPDIPVEGHSGLLYMAHEMSPPSTAQAATGLGADFVVDRLQRHESGRGAYFAFQLNKPVSVRIYDPADRDRQVECSCEEFKSARSICIHIYVCMVSYKSKALLKPHGQWLFDGLNAVLQRPISSSTQAINRSNVIARLSTLYGPIGSHLSTLPALLNSAPDETESDSDGATESSYTASNSSGRRDQVRDMLSAFDERTLFQDYGQDLPDTPAEGRLQDAYVPNNLAATVYQMAVLDESMFRRFRKVVTQDVCATSDFSKQRARARSIFAKLDDYIENGTSDEPQENFDVPRCARMLRFAVNQICQARDYRLSIAPLGPGVVTKVAETLVEILQDVCNRDNDVYYRIDWEREAPDDEPDRDRNLYAYLISEVPRFGASTPAWMNDTFIIDRLQQLPAMEWRHLIERLTSILDQMRDRMLDEDESPPPAYTKLERMIQEYTAEAFEPSSSSVQRRPTVGSQRESQRRRLE